jgi:hypothetical protein
MEIRETAQDRMHRLIEDSSSDHAILRSPEAESCKIYFIFSNLLSRIIKGHPVKASKDQSDQEGAST